MNIYFEAIEIENFRGFKEKQSIILSKKGMTNYIVGPNNSGKSLLSRALQFFKHEFTGSDCSKFTINACTDNDFHNLETDKPITLAIKLNNQLFQNTSDPDINSLVDKGDVWLEYLIHKCGSYFIGSILLRIGSSRSLQTKLIENELKTTNNTHFQTFYSLRQESIERICNKLYKNIQKSILIFDPIRSFDREGSDALTVSGMELVKWLSDPNDASQQRTARERVRGWLESELNLEAPSAVKTDFENKQLIFSFHDGIELSTKEIGTGYTMLYILLMEIVRSKKSIFIIDEIESHLQPGLIRRLMYIIKKHENAQFIISTHSPIVMETASQDDHLFRTLKISRECTISGFFRKEESNPDGIKIAREVCNELGVVPGDALLTNCVIWVEGPSEVFWLRTWLKNYLEKLRTDKAISYSILEGLHYSILMTGGNSISHISFVEGEHDLETIEEDLLLKVLRVNPNPFVIMDSDNAQPNSKKAQRHLRIAKELNEQNKYHPILIKDVVASPETELHLKLLEIPNLWVLAGKELENYSHPQLLKDFYLERSSHGNSTIKGVENCTDWDVYSTEFGTGNILELNGLTNVTVQSGSIKHKDELARYMFKNFEPKHFLKNSINGLQPNSMMIDDLIQGLDKIVNYIKIVNSL
nr:ATP-binding protein [Paenibacillus xylanexedens]